MLQYLLGFKACEAEHPNLVDDMLPVMGGTLLFQTCYQLFSHLNDAVSHPMDLLQPAVKNTQTMEMGDVLYVCLFLKLFWSVTQHMQISVQKLIPECAQFWCAKNG